METNRSATILIVDDEQPLVESYAAMLEREYKVETATTGEQALRTVSEEIDVVLLDRRMPEYTGAEVLAAIRDRDLGCQVVFCSAVVPDVEILTVEPDDYLHKPVSTDDLGEAIETQLDLAAQPESVREILRLDRLKSTLESAQSRSHLQSATAYQQLLDRLEQKREGVDESPDAQIA